MNYISVCSGIEAATCAWHPLGWTPVAFSEIEPFPCAVLAHHYPSVPNWGDMTKFQEWPDAAVDLLVGGTPCQSFSVAGHRKGLADPRGNLMLTYLAIAARYRPRWLVWENVPGVLSSNGGRDFGSLLGGLAELGYGFAYRVLDAQFFGVPQRRRRVFVVGCAGDWRRAAAVLFERHSLSGDPAPRRQTREDVALPVTTRVDRGGAHREAHGNNLIAPTLPARTRGGGGLGTDFDYDGGLITYAPEVSLCLNAGGMGRIDSESESMIAHSLRADGFDASEDGTGRGSPLVVAFDTTQITSVANRSSPKPGDACHPLAAHAHAPAIAFDARQSDVLQYGDLSGPLDTDGHSVSVGVGVGVRRLMPVECARLQGFPDDYLEVPYRGKPAADGPKYKALGNSMAVPCMAYIGQRIAAVEEITSQERAA